jgi:transposase
MECYIGLNVSLKQTSICVVNQTGSVVREGVVDSAPEAIAGFVRSKAPGAVRIGLETGPTATWLWTELERLGLPVICIDARHAKAVLKMQINKSDRNDAAGIARIMQPAGSRKCLSRTLWPRSQGAAGEAGVAG